MESLDVGRIGASRWAFGRELCSVVPDICTDQGIWGASVSDFLRPPPTKSDLIKK